MISATKKAYCDKELAKTNQKKDDKNARDQETLWHTVTRGWQRPTRRRMTPWSQHPLLSATKKAYCDNELAETNQECIL